MNTNPLLCPKCLKFILVVGQMTTNASLFCQCPSPLVTVTLTLTNGTVYTGTMGNPFKPRGEVPQIFQEAFKDSELEPS